MAACFILCAAKDACWPRLVPISLVPSSCLTEGTAAFEVEVEVTSGALFLGITVCECDGVFNGVDGPIATSFTLSTGATMSTIAALLLNVSCSHKRGEWVTERVFS
jgi:hypothetical protein